MYFRTGRVKYVLCRSVVHSCKYLGVIIDEQLNWREHIDHVYVYVYTNHHTIYSAECIILLFSVVNLENKYHKNCHRSQHHTVSKNQ